MRLIWALTWYPLRFLTVSPPSSTAPWPMALMPPLLRQATEEFPGLPIICEGRIFYAEEARAAIDAGAWAVS